MILSIKKSGRFTYLYALKGYRNDEGKSTTKVVKKFGTIEELKEKNGIEDPISWAKEQVAEMTAREKTEHQEVTLSLRPSIMLNANEQRCYNGGYLFIQKIYNELGLDKICKNISDRHKIEYDLNEILSNLLYTRIIYPGSKLSSIKDAGRFIEQPKSDLHQVYRALSLLSEENDYIQAALYKNSLKAGKRRTQAIYYDCTNYFFESEKEKGLRQYGMSKEHRPNPIVQMGMFMDMDGVPLAFCINPGNTNEQVTLKPLEDKLKDNFGISKVVVCTDGGLSSYENRKNDHVGERAFITVVSLKKLKKYLQDWSIESTGWHINGSDKTFDISKTNKDEHPDTLFYKDRWINENGLEQRIIVTFSFKYKEYLSHVRNKQIDRAQKLIDKGPALINKKNANDCKRLITRTAYTLDGEIAQVENYSLNQEMIDQEARFDGFYAICTDLEDCAPDIIKANSGRWIIENGFRVMKTEFEARPVFLQRDDRIKAHFLTCFLALALYKYLEKKINKGINHFTPCEIVETLTDMNFLSVEGEGYIPTYTRTVLTNALHATAEFRTDTQIVTKKMMRCIIASTKNRRKQKNNM